MKTVGIIGAMEEEIAELKERAEIFTTKNVIGIDFYVGTLNSKSIIITRCGIGKVNAAVCAQVLIDMFAVDYIINLGVAGALDSGLSIGDVVISTETAQHDFDVTLFDGQEPGFIPRLDMKFFQADAELINIAAEAGSGAGANTFTGRIISGDQFIADADKKQAIKQEFDALCVDMESAAVGHACYLNKLPYVAIRAISDKADATAQTNFSEFVKEAAKKSADIVDEMLKFL